MLVVLASTLDKQEPCLAAGTAESPEVFTDMESPEMSGRAVVALASDPDVMRWTGKVGELQALLNQLNSARY